MIFYLSESYFGQAFPCLSVQIANRWLIKDDHLIEKIILIGLQFVYDEKCPGFTARM